MSKLLIVVDVQNDFVTGSLGTPEAQGALDNIRKKILSYRSVGDEVVFTRDTHYEDYPETQEGKNLPVMHCLFGTYGWEVVSQIDVPECLHIDKKSFGYPGWDADWLGQFDAIELIGFCTDICVVSNALIIKALCPEIPLFVDASCCAGVTPESHRAALETMKMCQISCKNV